MNENLRLISTFHYVVGALHFLCFSFPLIHFFVGLAFVLNPPHMQGQGNEPFPPQLFGLFFMGIGGALVLFGWTLGVVTIMSGRRIAQRRSRTFSIVVAAINCAFMPFGTALGVFTLILLNKTEAQAQYGAGSTAGSQESTVNSQLP